MNISSAHVQCKLSPSSLFTCEFCKLSSNGKILIQDCKTLAYAIVKNGKNHSVIVYKKWSVWKFRFGKVQLTLWLKERDYKVTILN